MTGPYILDFRKNKGENGFDDYWKGADMNITEKPIPRPFKSYAAVLAGFIVTITMTSLTDMLFRQLRIFPNGEGGMSNGLFGLALLYRVFFNVFGCYIAAKLAPYYPTRHAIALGVIITIASSLGAYKMWGMGPAWYSIADIVIAIPCAWIGGKMYERLKKNL